VAQQAPGDRRQAENEIERLEIDSMKPEDAPLRRWLRLGRTALKSTNTGKKSSGPEQE
jgi:hypothetical protein